MYIDMTILVIYRYRKCCDCTIYRNNRSETWTENTNFTSPAVLSQTQKGNLWFGGSKDNYYKGEGRIYTI